MVSNIFIFHNIWDNVVLPIDELTFFRGVIRSTTNQCMWYIYIYIDIIHPIYPPGGCPAAQPSSLHSAEAEANHGRSALVDGRSWGDFKLNLGESMVNARKMLGKCWENALKKKQFYVISMWFKWFCWMGSWGKWIMVGFTIQIGGFTMKNGEIMGYMEPTNHQNRRFNRGWIWF